ncbi:MAG: ABC transporter permease [Peptoniphilaceae bacterium]
MLKYISKKLLLMIPMLVIISLLIFFALQAMPVDPINYLLPPEASQDSKIKEELREKYGLNDPKIVQYKNWITNIVKGDFGYSILTGQSIKDILAKKMPATLQLALVALVISSVFGILLGILSAVNQNSIIDYIGRIIGVIGQSIPQFLFGMILISIFALKLKLVPAGGRNLYGQSGLLSNFKAIILPATALSLGMVATVLRYTRNSMLDVINKEYVKTARSKGIPERKVYLKHAFRNSMGPILVTILFRIPGLIGGSVVIETVFNWPGIGSTLMGAVTSGDYPVIMVTTLLLAVVMLIVSFLVDIFSAMLDPRVRLDG